MANEPLAAALAELVERLAALVADDAALRQRLRALAAQVIQLCDEHASVPAGWPAEGSPSESERASPLPATDLAPVAASGDVAVPGERHAPPARGVPVPQPGPAWVDTLPAIAPVVEMSDADLPLIERRCRLKAEGARWAAERQRRQQKGADFRLEIEPVDRDTIEKARALPDCFLWMNHASGPVPEDLGLLDDLAGCFETVADAIAVVRSLLAETALDEDQFDEALQLMAEAQSRLRAAVRLVGWATDDGDQSRAHRWLRMTCTIRQIYIERFMRADDRPDPRARQQRGKSHQADINRIRYHLKPIRNARGDRSNDWQRVIETSARMVEAGEAPSSVVLRELLVPVIDRLPEGPFPRNFALVLREIDRFLATATRAAPEDETETDGAVEEVRRVAEWLHGRALVLIGGVRRPHAHEALQEAFGLARVDWVETREHESIDRFENHIARPDVAVVLLAIRWISHSFGDIRPFCERHGKPLVRLRGGYNPNQVAVHILAQCSERLGSGAGECDLRPRPTNS
jgi:hypothetical protein